MYPSLYRFMPKNTSLENLEEPAVIDEAGAPPADPAVTDPAVQAAVPAAPAVPADTAAAEPVADTAAAVTDPVTDTAVSEPAVPADSAEPAAVVPDTAAVPAIEPPIIGAGTPDASVAADVVPADAAPVVDAPVMDATTAVDSAADAGVPTDSTVTTEVAPVTDGTAPADAVAAIEPAVTDTAAAVTDPVADTAGATDSAVVPAESAANVDSVAAGAEVVTSADLPESSLLQANDISAEIERNDNEIDAALDTSNTMNSMADQMEEAVENGEGLTELGTKVIEPVLEAYYKRLNFPKPLRYNFATENFASKANRIVHTKLAMEELRRTAASMIQGVINGIMNAAALVQKFFMYIFDTATGLAKRADALAHAAQTQAASTNAITLSNSAVSFLTQGGKVPEGGAMVSAYQSLNRQTGEIVQKLFDGTANLNSQLNDAMKDAKTPEKTGSLVGFGTTVRNLTKGLNLAKGGADLAPEGMQAFVEQFVLGNYALVAIMPAEAASDQFSEDQLDALVAKCSEVKITIEPVNQEAGEGGEVAPLTADEIKKICALVSVRMKAYANFKSKVNEISSLQKQSIAAAKQLMGATEDETSRKRFGAIVGLARATMGLSSKSLTRVSDYDMKVAKAVLDYAASSLSKASAPAEAAA